MARAFISVRVAIIAMTPTLTINGIVGENTISFQFAIYSTPCGDWGWFCFFEISSWVGWGVVDVVFCFIYYHNMYLAINIILSFYMIGSESISPGLTSKPRLFSSADTFLSK